MKLHLVASAWMGMAVCLSAQVPNLIPPTPLLKSLVQNDTVASERLLADGANPNEGRYVGFPPIFFTAIHQNLRVFRKMLEKGADIRAKDPTGSNLLMWAAFNEPGSSDFVDELLRLGLDPNEPDLKGDTALTWALRKGSDTPAVRALRTAGGANTQMIQRAAESAIALLQKSSTEFVKVSGCSSCHHQSLPMMAAAIARTRGFSVNEHAAQQQVKTVIGMFSPLREEMLLGISRFPDAPVSIGYSLLGLAASGYAPDETTAAMTHLIASQQLTDGGFRTIPARPPLESSDFTATALSLRAMQLYGTGAQDQIRRAAEWLRTETPRTTEDRVMQLLGLKWANTDSGAIRAMSAALVAAQRVDGGWAQLPQLGSDAYATGQVLVALERSGAITATDPVYRRGVDFLMRTKLEDGSWLVQSRSFPVQAYKESGYPHGQNQWISAAGSSWAAMALSLSAPPSQRRPMAAGF